METDYYFVLGVPPNASREEVRNAFRRRAMELHPDRSGFGSGPFLAAQEAYGVLSDAERRQRYDETRETDVRHYPWGPAVEPISESPVMGVRPRGVPGTFHQVSLTESFDTWIPSFEEIFHRLWSNFSAASRPKGEHLETLTAEVRIDPEDALNGGRIELSVPGRATCAYCGGGGSIDFQECWRCLGQGSVLTDYILDLEYAPGVRDGHVIQVPLTGLGIGNLHLTIVLRVGAAD